ncbi:Arginine-hydroxylase NDUFAF5-like, partial [Homarus americanus]
MKEQIRMSQRLMHRTAQRFVSPCGCAFVDNGLFRQGLPASVRQCKLLQRERAARNPDVAVFDYLKEEVGYRLSDRILDIKRELKVGLDLGCGRGYVELRHLYMSDFSPAMLEAAQTPENIGFTKILIDEEQKFPLESKLFDLVISNLNLHWVNNLPQCLKEIRRVLKEDGAFLASMFGGDTLFELRSSLDDVKPGEPTTRQLTEVLTSIACLSEQLQEYNTRPHPRNLICPVLVRLWRNIRPCTCPVLMLDTDEITVGYPSLFELMWDLQGMAENNAGVSRKPHLHRDTLLAASAIYQEMYGKEEGIPATFQIIYMIGWKPDPKQVASQAERGSGQVSLKDLHKLDNIIQESGMEGRIKFVKDMIEDNDKNKKN